MLSPIALILIIGFVGSGNSLVRVLDVCIVVATFLFTHNFDLFKKIKTCGKWLGKQTGCKYRIWR